MCSSTCYLNDQADYCHLCTSLLTSVIRVGLGRGFQHQWKVRFNCDSVGCCVHVVGGVVTSEYLPISVSVTVVGVSAPQQRMYP